jgi:hypothetical protein
VEEPVSESERPAGSKWEQAEGLVAEKDAEELEVMSLEELRAELKAKEIDPARPRELARAALARADANAAAKGKAGPPSDVAKEPAEAAALHEQAVQGTAHQAVDAPSGRLPAAEGTVVSLEERRAGRRSAVIGGLLLAAVVAGLFLLVKGGEIVAYFRPKPVPTPVPTPTQEEAPPKQVAAGNLRDEAREACKQYNFLLCLQKLDEARAIDPAGDGEPEVQALRKSATEELRPEPDKPGGGNRK